MKRRCRVVEVTHPGVNGGCLPDGCRVASLLAEVEYAESIGDKVQASKEEGLGWLEDGWNPHPTRWGSRKLQRAKRIVSPKPAMVKVAEKWAIR